MSLEEREMGNEEMNPTAITEVKHIEREELWAIEQRARRLAEITANPHWKRAYQDLAYAANVVDAHIGRSTD